MRPRASRLLLAAALALALTAPGLAQIVKPPAPAAPAAPKPAAVAAPVAPAAPAKPAAAAAPPVATPAAPAVPPAVAAAAAAAKPAAAKAPAEGFDLGPGKTAGDLIRRRRDGAPFFMLGVNLGNVKFLPFAKADQYSHSPDELRGILNGAFKEIAAAGGNTVRFWLHVDGSQSPEFDGAGLTSGISPDTVADLKWALQKARDAGLEIILSLWSHDILAVRRCNPPSNRDRALRIWEEDAALDAYVKNALAPMMRALGSARMTDGKSFLEGGVLAWEIMNEPEEACFELEGNTDYQYKVTKGEYTYANPSVFNADPRRRVDYQNITFLARDMQRVDPKDAGQAIYYGDYFLKTYKGKDYFNWYMYHDVFGQFNSDFTYLLDQCKNKGLTTRGISSAARVQRTVNRMTAAIKREDPKALVTVGADSIIYNTDRPGLKLQDWKPAARNLYKDAALVAAGGDPLGTLDFYQVHSYPDWSDPNVNDYDRDKMVFWRDKAFWQLDKPLLGGEFWDAVAGGPQGKNPVTPDLWYGLLGKGYAGGLGWAWFDVQEEAGYGLASPWRRVVKHAMQSHWAGLMPEVAAKLANPAHVFRKVDVWRQAADAASDVDLPSADAEATTEGDDDDDVAADVGGGGSVMVASATAETPTPVASVDGAPAARPAAPAPGASPGARSLTRHVSLDAALDAAAATDEALGFDAVGDAEAGGDAAAASHLGGGFVAAEAARQAATADAAAADRLAGGGAATDPADGGPHGPLAGGGEHGPPGLFFRGRALLRW